jgi:hypothetical protein
MVQFENIVSPIESFSIKLCNETIFKSSFKTVKDMF